MLGKKQTVTTTAAVLVDGRTGSAERPVRALIRAETGTIYLGGPGVLSTAGFSVVSTDAPVTVTLIGEQLYAIAGSSIVVQVLASGL